MTRKKEKNGFFAVESLRILKEKATDGTWRDLLRDFAWIFSLSRRHIGGILLYTLLGILIAASALVSAVAGKYFIDSIITADGDRLIPMALLMTLMWVFSLVLRGISSRFTAKLKITVHNDIRSLTFEQLLRARWLEIRRFSTGDLLSRFSTDLRTLSGCAVSWLPSVVVQLFTLLSTLCVVLYYDPVMALIAFASTPVLFLVSRGLLRRQRQYTRDMRRISSDISAFETDTFRNMDTLKSFGAEGEMVERLDAHQADYRELSLEYNRFSVQANLQLSLLGGIVQGLAMAYCLWRLWRGDIQFGTMVLFLQQRSRLSEAFTSLAAQIPAALNGSVAAERIRELTELEKEPPAARELPRVNGSCAVKLKNVSAGYTGDRFVLSGVELLVEPGQTVALIGPSGEGKSTLMRLILGLLPPHTGELHLTDQTGTCLKLGADTRHLIAYVPQGNTVLEGTVAENLRLVNPGVTEEEMIRALQDACAWEFVEPMGLDGRIGEGGKGLSEGQAQRIAIARALVRNAPVLLLDEATGSLDRDTEKRILANLAKRNVTCITATHRMSVLDLCHRVYRIRDGGIDRLTSAEIEYLQEG